jgi:hypothetical protein
VTLAEDFRDELLERDARLLRGRTRAIIAVIRALDSRITELSEALATKPGSLAELAEYQALRAEAVQRLSRFSADTATAIERAEVINVDAATEEARLLVEDRLPPGFTPALLGLDWQQPGPSALEVLSGKLAAGTPLNRYLSARIVRGTMADVRETLRSGIGDNPRLTARALKTSFAGGMSQALRITRTETLGAYRTAARMSYEANPRLVTGYRRHEALDHRTCVACWLMDGVLYHSESEMEEHVTGRGYLSPELVSWRELGIVGVPEEPIEVSGRERFLELDEDAQRAIVHNDRQYELLRSGQIGLSDLIQRRVHPDFGASLTQASARASLAGEGTLSRLPSLTEATPIASLVNRRLVA